MAKSKRQWDFPSKRHFRISINVYINDHTVDDCRYRPEGTAEHMRDLKAALGKEATALFLKWEDPSARMLEEVTTSVEELVVKE